MRRVLIALLVSIVVTGAHAATQEILPVRADGSACTWFDIRVESLPELIYRLPPEYPAIAREAGVDGTVLVLGIVDTNGVVTNALIKKSIPMLDAAALNSVRQWRFRPALSNGSPVPVWVGLPIRFDLHAAPEPDPGPPPALRATERTSEHQRPPDDEPLRPAQWPEGWSRGERGILLAEQIVLDRLPKVTEALEADTHWVACRSPLYARFELVVAHVRVERDGRVGAARIVRSVAGCDSVALRSVTQWRFRPARSHGKTVPVSIYVPVPVRTR